MKILLRVWNGLETAVEVDALDLEMRFLVDCGQTLGTPAAFRRWKVAVFQQTGHEEGGVPVLALTRVEQLDGGMLCGVRA